jgi:hypothetical protein
MHPLQKRPQWHAMNTLSALEVFLKKMYTVWLLNGESISNHVAPTAARQCVWKLGYEVI